jgi:hypothetical protein
LIYSKLYEITISQQEPLPDLTPEDLAREAEQEAAIFSQAANIDKLINMLRGLDPAKDNLADNEEIQVSHLIYIRPWSRAKHIFQRNYTVQVWL